MSNNPKILLVKAKANNSPRSEAGTSFKTEADLAEHLIDILRDAGYTYDEMIPVFRLAREKYNHLLKLKQHENN